MITESVFTVNEVAQHLQVPIEVVLSEIDEGRLKALLIGEFKRIPESELTAYKKQALSSTAESNSIKSAAIDLDSTADFTFRWPKMKEKFTHAQEGVVQHNGRDYHVKVGFTTRRSAGTLRRRSLVLVDRYPTVEFVASNTTAKNGKMASIIKDRHGKHLPGMAAPPQEYADIPVGSYRDIVDGPRAYNGLAVICRSDDLATMVRHALIRHTYRQERPKVRKEEASP